MKELRLSGSQRVTGVIWGLIVAGAAVTAMVALSGTEVKIVNVAIVALVALGTWLVASALAAIRPRKVPAPPSADDIDSTVADAAQIADEVAAEVNAEVAAALADVSPEPKKPKG